MSSKAYEARQSPAFKATVGDRTYTPQQVQTNRTTYYTTVYRDRYIPQPVGTSYGSFSEMFMWSMMFNAAFAHNRSDDPAYRQWRRDADERAKSDDKVRAQLAELDAKVKALESTPKDANYMPKDVPPEAIFTEEALTTKSNGGRGWLFWFAAALSTIVLGSIAFVLWPRSGRFA